MISETVLTHLMRRRSNSILSFSEAGAPPEPGLLTVGGASRRLNARLITVGVLLALAWIGIGYRLVVVQALEADLGGFISSP